MATVSPTEVLCTEHRAILRMLDVTSELAHLLEVGVDVPPDMLDAVAEFMRVFGDEHLKKEEEFLFPALGKRGVALDGVAVDTLQRDHDQARTLLGKMSDAAVAYRAHRPKADRKWGRVATEYAMVMRRHIDKEQQIFYPAAEQILSADEQRNLGETLRRGSEDSGTLERHRHFSQMADSLAAELLA
ncbi:MAG TPA: hemerythrin domain-containing protein [Candidatus Acidoferrales bacterium]|nr:hemerythrin domain-containing protein [Candidatus Acidoferrales bacterium]